MPRPSSGSGCLGGGLRTVPDPAPGVIQASGCPRSHGCRKNSWPTWVENPKPPGPFFPLQPPWMLSGTRWDAGESGQGREGLGVCSAPGLSLLPAPTLPPITRPVRLEQRSREPQHFWWGGGKSYQNVIASHEETACLGVAFLGRCEHFPAPPSPRSTEVLSSRAPQCPGQVSGRVPRDRQCPNSGAAAKP